MSRKIFTCEVCSKKFEAKSGRTQRFCSVKCKGVYTRTGQSKICPVCSKEYWVTKSREKVGWGITCSRKCWNRYRRKPHINYDGYVMMRMENGKDRGVHRIVMEKHLHRKLKSWEVIHHKDGNKLNNEISNLEIVVQNLHGKTTRSQALKEVRCPYCLKHFKTEGCNTELKED